MKVWSVSLVIVLGVVLGSVGYLLGSLFTGGSSAPPAGPATVYNPPLPLPAFTLADQTGQPYALSSSKGKVVLMAFLFTHCGDVCPFSAVKMRLALEQLGDAA